MRIGSTGNVGIGTSSPGVKLDVIGGVRISSGNTGGAYLLDYATADVNSRNWAIYNDYAAFGDFTFVQSTIQTGSPNLPRLYINPTGNVGIGTTSITAIWGRTLQIGDGSGASNLSLLGTGAGTAGDGYIASTGATEFQIIARASTDLILGTNDQERVRVSSTGQVGIGFSTPVTAIYGTTVRAFNAGNGATLQLGGTAVNAYFYVNESATVSAIGTSSNHPFFFFTNDTERMRIAAGGTLLLGTTTTPTSATTGVLAFGAVGTAPSAVSAGGALYVDSGGILKYRNSTGLYTVTII
jgi:hypothetical protein